ncbi:MAG: thiamine ABC transporter substrate-binding protein [Acidimicrobiales bacterium]
MTHTRLLALAFAVSLFGIACSSDDGPAAASDGGEVGEQRSVTLLTHDSFLVSDSVFEAFELETGIEVEVLTGGDTGSVAAQLILTADDPVADVVFGIDNTFLARVLGEDLFTPYESPRLDVVDESLVLDPDHRVTPIDYGDVCINYWIEGLEGPPPRSLDDLTDPLYASQWVTPNPETSSPGLALLLATIARYGEDGWEQWWAEAADAGLAVTSTWTDAYYGEFIAGGGERNIVTSYATSPPAEVVFADPPRQSPPTGVMTDGCFRQVEFAGILTGADDVGAARELIDFMLSTTFQEDIPLSMFVYPAASDAALPDVFVEHGVAVDEPLTLDPATIAANVDEWTRRWVEIVLR